LSKVNIPDFYHKNPKKSRSLGRRIDIILLVATVVVLVLVIINRPSKKVVVPQHIDEIAVSSKCEDYFGKKIVDALIQEFEEQHPNLRIQLTGQDTSVTADGVDIVFFDDNAFDEPEQLSVHAVSPLVSFMDIFFYNIDILQAADCDRPPKTRAEFLTTARAVAKKYPPVPWQETIFAFTLGLSDQAALRRDIYPWIWADGGEIYSPGTDGTVTLSRTALNTISFLGQMDREGLIAPQSFEKTGAQRLEEFAKGKVAMITASARSITFLRQNAPNINFGITTVPATTLGRSRLGLSGIYAGVNYNSALPEEAGIFLDFIAGKSQILAEALGAVPGSFPSAFPGEYIVKDALYSKAWDIFEAAEIIGYPPGQSSEGEINRIIRERLLEAIKN
jgi:multiple sugar transport system substrate-binding protein